MTALTVDQMEYTCTLATLILSDEGAAVTEASIKKLIAAAGLEVEPYLPMLFSRALGKMDVSELLTKSVGSGPSGAAAGGSAVAGAAAAADEEEEEPEEESDDDMGFSLFD
ncbi:MAG: uncharacterized protein KVP18_003243 [Porospora cf. gigantea A]|uniref:uncharacterized protein n=2 Tax=Porospora cf. gigantea A TaxID=2853593 RepID=UPI003559C06E|nr:MAG: hypothetical protein KVP18_003243 [Porospora cf. gigantea A]